MNNALRRFCKIIAVIFHPLLIPTFIFTIVVYLTTGIIGNLSDSQKHTFILIIFVSTFLMPLMVVILQLLFKNDEISWKSLFIENTKDRVEPFLIVSFIYGVLSFYTWQNWGSNEIISIILGAISASIFLTAIISKYWKISAHSVGIGGLCGICILLNLHYLQPKLFIAIIISIVSTGILLSSRIYLQAHTLSQVYLGWLLGVGVCLSSIVLL